MYYRSARRGRGPGGLTVGGRRDYTPVSWRKYWDSCKDVTLEGGDVFRVYQRGSEGPLLVLLHGGGYSALTWSLFAVRWLQLLYKISKSFHEIEIYQFSSRLIHTLHITNDECACICPYMYGKSRGRFYLNGNVLCELVMHNVFLVRQVGFKL